MMRTTCSVFLALALMAFPWGTSPSLLAPSGNEEVRGAVMATGSFKIAEAPMLGAMIGGTVMNWCVAMVGAALGAVALSGGLALGFAFVWAVTCWSGG